jgi:rhodanese-related sulfurtransferase
MTRPVIDARGLPPDYPFNPDWEATPLEVKTMFESSEKPLLIDCRTGQERDLARIEGSVHVPMQELSTHLDRLREFEDAPVIVHCHHGARSLKVTAALRAAGFTNVRSMAGGIHLWSLVVDPSIPGY